MTDSNVNMQKKQELHKEKDKMYNETEQIIRKIHALNSKINVLESKLEKEYEKTYQDCFEYMKDKIGKSYALGNEIVTVLSVETSDNVFFVNCSSLEIEDKYGRIYIAYCNNSQKRICGDFYKGGFLATLKQEFNPKTEINFGYFNQIVPHILYIRDAMNFIKTQEK